MNSIFQFVKIHLVIFEVLVPFFSSLLIIFCRNTSIALAISRLCTTLEVILGSYGIYLMIYFPPYFYAVGNWQAPIGIEYRVDPINQFIILLSNLILFILLVFNSKLIKTNLEKSLTQAKAHLLYCILLLLHTGFCGIVVSNDLFNIYVFIEIASLASYTLISQGFDKRALIGSINYLILGTIGATLMLIAIGFLLSCTGSLNINDIAIKLPQQNSKTLIAAVIFYIIGCLLKVALFPMNSWLISAYKYTSSLILSYFAPVSALVGFYTLLYFVYHIIGVNYVNNLYSHFLINIIALVSTVFCSYYSMQQNNLKAMMAYSIGTEVGYISLVIFNLYDSTIGAQLVVILFTSCVVKSAIYSLISQIELYYQDNNLARIEGIGSSHPMFSVLLILNLVCNLGLPFTIGFINKLNIFLAVLQVLGCFSIMILSLSACMSFSYNCKIFHYICATKLESNNTFQFNGNSLAALSLTIISYLMLIFYNQLILYLKSFFTWKII